MLSVGILQTSHIDALAQQLAGFHAQLPVIKMQSPSDYPQVIQNHLTRPIKNLPPEINHLQLRQLTDSLLTLFKQQEKTLQTRMQQGFVRQCGRLRLDDITFLENKIVIPNLPPVYWIDVIDGLSGLLVDLESQHASALAARLLNLYLEYTGSYMGLKLLQFYKAYQAFIRAKIVICQLQKQNRENSVLVQQYQTYLTLLERYLQRQPSPLLILTYGVSGSGKSTVTQLLLSAIGGIRLRADVERKRLFGLDWLERGGAERGLYHTEISQQVFKGLETLTRYILQAGFPVIVDATFLQRANRAPFRRLAHTLDILYVVLACHASEDTLFQRVLARQQKDNDPSDADISILKQQLTVKESLGTDEQIITVDTDQPLEMPKIVRKLHSITSFNLLTEDNLLC